MPSRSASQKVSSSASVISAVILMRSALSARLSLMPNCPRTPLCCHFEQAEPLDTYISLLSRKWSIISERSPTFYKYQFLHICSPVYYCNIISSVHIGRSLGQIVVAQHQFILPYGVFLALVYQLGAAVVAELAVLYGTL